MSRLDYEETMDLINDEKRYEYKTLSDYLIDIEDSSDEISDYEKIENRAFLLALFENGLLVMKHTICGEIVEHDENCPCYKISSNKIKLKKGRRKRLDKTSNYSRKKMLWNSRTALSYLKRYISSGHSPNILFPDNQEWPSY